MGYAPIALADGTKCYSGPNCLRHAGKQATSKTAMNSDLIKRMDKLDQQINPLAKDTPAAIDSMVAPIYNEYNRAQADYFNIIKAKEEKLKRLETAVKASESSSYYGSRVDEIKKSISFLEKNEVKAKEEMANILAETEPYEAEYKRRGGWTRAFIVVNTNGHVHKSMHCSSCYPTTQYSWLPEYSGSDESKIIEDAGSSACTVCYPNAPVSALKRKTVIEDPIKKAARIDRDKVKQERLQKANEKGITNPDGGPLVVVHYGSKETMKTFRSAEIKAVDIIADLNANDNPDLYLKFDADRKAEHETAYNTLLEALASKHDKPKEELDALYRDKGAKKYVKEWLKN